jgi:hypothetical protein
MRPWLNFSFRFQSGYTVDLPMAQFFGPGHGVVMLTRVTPEAGDQKPVYLLNRVSFPDIPKTNVTIEFGGGYVVGEGRYKVETLLSDDADRLCRKTWRITAKRSGIHGDFPLGMQPDTVRALYGPRQFRDASEIDDMRPIRLTVLMHAAPLWPRMTKFPVYDRLVLLGSVASLLERLPAKSVRLIVFNLDQQRELYREDHFEPGKVQDVARTLNELELGLVNIRTLQNRRGHMNLIADLINQERDTDAVIFLGPTARYFDKFPEEAIDPQTSDGPLFFYFQYKPYWARGADFPDSVAYAMKRVRGKTIIIHAPEEFAKAIKQVREQIAQK